MDDAPVLPVDVGLGQRRRDAPQEVVAVPRDVEPDEVVAEHPAQYLASVRAGAEHVPRRPRDVPGVDAKGALGDPTLDHLGGQPEVVVVEPDDRPGVGRIGDGVGEALVDALVVVPEPGIAVDVGQRGVTDGPQHPVAEAVVVVVDLLVGEPEPFEGVLPLALPRRDRDLSVLVDDVGVRVAVAPGDPRAVHLAHDRVETGRQPAGGCVDCYPVTVVVVGVAVGLAIRENEKFLARDTGRGPGRTAVARPLREM